MKQTIFANEWELIQSLDTENLSETELIQKIQEYFPKFTPEPVDQWETNNAEVLAKTRSVI